jgi:hypothetical protein
MTMPDDVFNLKLKFKVGSSSEFTTRMRELFDRAYESPSFQSLVDSVEGQIEIEFLPGIHAAGHAGRASRAG